MRTILISFLVLFSMTLSAKMTQEQQVSETVSKLFIYMDNNDWPKLKKLFTKHLVFDYSSINNKPAKRIHRDQLIKKWKGFLPGFDYTHHQIGNMVAKVKDKRAAVFCYTTINHFIADEDDGELWEIVGDFNLSLRKYGKKWLVTKMKFNLKYQLGNPLLGEVAIKRAPEKIILQKKAPTKVKL